MKKLKYIKRINELFDSPELKDRLEIPRLSGDLDPEKLVSYPSIINDESDPLLLSLCNSIPWLRELGYIRDNNKTLRLGFSGTKDDKYTFYYFDINITEDVKKIFSLKVVAKCIEDDNITYEQGYEDNKLNYNELINKIKREVFTLLVNYNNWLKQQHSVSHFSISNPNIVIFDPTNN